MRKIAKFEIKNLDIVKGIQMEGVRKIGNAINTIPKIINKNKFIEEVILIDISASLYDIIIDNNIIKNIVENFFLPVTVGGGINNIEQVKKLFFLGCERVTINSFLKNDNDFEFINKISKIFGTQSIVIHLELSSIDGSLFSFREYGREVRNMPIFDLFKKCIDCGAGEIHLISIDADGLNKGPNNNILELSSKISKVPVVYSGGIRNFEDINYIDENFNSYIDGVAFSSMLYQNLLKNDN